MTREQKTLSLLAKFKYLGIDKQIDYGLPNKFYLYSLITHSTAIEAPVGGRQGRMSRLLMNQLQFELGIIPANINKERKAEYIEVLIATRENDDIELFRNFIFDEYIHNLEKIIHNYQTSMEYNGIKIT